MCVCIFIFHTKIETIYRFFPLFSPDINFWLFKKKTLTSSRRSQFWLIIIFDNAGMWGTKIIAKCELNNQYRSIILILSPSSVVTICCRTNVKFFDINLNYVVHFDELNLDMFHYSASAHTSSQNKMENRTTNERNEKRITYKMRP